MYITAGFFNVFLKHFEHIEVNLPKLFSGFDTDIQILESPHERFNAGILGQYLEQIVAKTGNPRIGLETGFTIPFSVTGSIYNICRDHKTPRELFSIPFDFSYHMVKDIDWYVTREEGDFLYFEIMLNQEFENTYPIAARQWREMQYGVSLQFAYSFTGRYLYPVCVHSPYPQEGERDRLTEFLSCPVKYGQQGQVLVFNKNVLDLPLITPNVGLLPVFEAYIHEIRLLEEQHSAWTNSVYRHLMHSLSSAHLSLDSVAEKFNMSSRNLHRKLKEEGTSYQQILDRLRMELSLKYLKEKISLTEIAFLLGFDSQSAFNKFFRKKFNSTPNKFNPTNKTMHPAAK